MSGAANRVLRIQANGRTVEGRVRSLGERDLAVEITAPFSGVADATHVPCFAPPHHRLARGGLLTPRGRQAARRLLREIHDACAFCRDHDAELVRACRRFLAERAGCGLGGFLPPGVARFLLARALGSGGLLGALVADPCRTFLGARFGRWLPEDLVRQLLARALGAQVRQPDPHQDRAG